MKNRIIILILLFSIVIPTYSQETNVFHIDATQTTPLKLSEIADNVTLVPLNKEITQVQGSAFWTGEYLFIATSQEVWQYDTSGNFLRAILCDGGSIDGVTGDLTKKELFISVNIAEKEKSEIWCYDYLGNFHRKIPLKNSSIVSILFHNNLLWILSEKFIEKKTCGYYSYVDISTGEETFLSETFERPAEKGVSGQYYSAGFVGTLSVSNKCLYANWDNNDIWRIEGNRVNLAFKCEVMQKYRNELICLKGVIGNYLFFNYYLDDGKNNLYIRHIITGKTYNVRYNGTYGIYTEGAIEDIYNSGYFDITRDPLSQDRYFWFIKRMSDKFLENKPIKGNQVVFIIKTKR